MSVPLGDVATFVRGITYKPTDLVPNFSDGSIVCMRTANVQNVLADSNVLSIPRSFVKDERKILREGDLLVSSANSWNLVGKCCWVPALTYEATVGGFIAALRGDPTKVDARYLYRWFSSAKTQANVRNCGRQTTNISNMDFGRCIELKIPLPSLSEQQRIAAILDKADALRAKRGEAIAKLDQLMRSLFLDMFGDPVTNRMGWPVVQFGNVTESRLGKMLDEKTRVGEYMRPYLANVNVRWGQFELDNLRQMNFKPDDQGEFSLRYGDVLMCEGGEPGRCAIWKEQLQDCYYQKALHRIRCNPVHCVPEYVQWLFWFLAKAGAFRSSIAVATIAHLPGVKLKKLAVPLPPLALQEKFAQDADEIGQMKSALEHSADQLDILFASLQHRAFSGTL